MNRAVTTWGSFVKERFPPLVNVPFAFLLAGTAAAAAVPPSGWETASILKACLLACAMAVFLFRLRLMDEIKDYAEDRVVNPRRPLARGLIPLSRARKAAAVLAVLEAALTIPAGLAGLAAWAAAAGFSLLMYREFFAGGFLRPRLFLYASLHAPSAMLAAVWAAAGSACRWPWELGARAWWYAASLVPATLLYDVTRKTWDPGDEVRGRASYSASLGVRGSARLSALLALVAGCAVALALSSGGDSAGWRLLFAAPAVLMAAAFLAARKARIVQALGLIWMAGLPLLVLGGVIT